MTRTKVPKPYEIIGFGAMDVTKPYKFIGFGAMDVTKPLEDVPKLLFLRFGPGDVRLWGSKRPSPSQKPPGKGGGAKHPTLSRWF